jgi:integrase
MPRRSNETRIAREAGAKTTRSSLGKDNVRERIVRRVVDRANELRAREDEPPILAHVTPHTLRRTYISFMLAAGFDLPYLQEQIGHQALLVWAIQDSNLGPLPYQRSAGVVGR